MPLDPYVELQKLHDDYMEQGTKYLAALKEHTDLANKHVELLRDHNRLLRQQIYLLKMLEANDIPLPPGELDAI